jgi:hypothetical protein
MAHKIKVHAVPHINRDGSVGTKKDYVVRCKRRGAVCTHEKFSTRREADAHVVKHWEFVNYRKSSLAEFPKTRPSTLRVIQNFQFALDRKRRPRVNITISANTSNFTNAISAAQRQIQTGVHAA